MDKLLHIFLSYSITLTSFVFLHNIFFAGLIGIIFSIIKELWDYVIKKQDAKEHNKDLICDIIGITIAMIITFMSR